MSTTLNKLEYLDETKGQIKNALNTKFNAQITDSDTFRSYVTKINNIYTNWTKVTGEGTTLSLNSTKKGKLALGLSGNTYQYSTTGKQLFNVSQITPPTGVSIDSNGWITITYDNTSGSSTKYFELFTSNLNLNTSTTYKSIVEIKNISGTGALFPVSSHTSSQFSYGYGLNFNELTADTTYVNTVETKSNFSGTSNGMRGFVQFNAGESGSITYRLSLVADTTVTPSTFVYEPYTNGASPNPDYPQDIEVVTGDNEVDIVGKNLLEPNIEGNWVSDYIPVKANKPYIYSESGVGTTCFVYFYETLEDEGTYTYVGANEAYTPTQDGYIRINKGTSTQINLMLEQNSTITSYEPYQIQTYTINLGNIELCKIVDYKDSIIHQNNKWYKHAEIGKVVLDGSEEWLTNLTNRFHIRYDLGINQTGEYSNYYKKGDVETTNNTFEVSGNFIYIRDERYTSKDDFKTWLTTHNTIIYYALKTPTNTEITDETLISQLNAIKSAYSYDDTTNINQTNDNLPFIISASALMKGGN